MKTVRFTQVVASCGAPGVHLTWVAPEQDPTLKAALKQNRVMTVHQNIRGTTRDYGTIGLLKTPHAQLLVFPRSLKRFADRRVVGIDYSLLASVPEKAKGGGSLPKAQAKKAATTASDPKSKRTREKAELISFGSGGDLADDADRRTRSDVVEKPVEPAAPPTWQELAKEIMQARKKLQQRRIAAAREQLLRLENWIRNTRKLSQEV
jgi:hypothetical protein